MKEPAETCTFTFGAPNWTVTGTLDAIRALEDYISEVESAAHSEGYNEGREYDDR